MAKLNSPDGSKSDVETLKKAIRGLESPKAKRDRERVALFTEVYPAIRDQLNAGVSKSAMVKTLAEHDVSITNLKFDELLAAEAKRRGEPVPGKGADMSTQVASAGESAQAPGENEKEGK
ncbi:hypothetical protein [Ralstonia pickettii]|jgi:hypothetical protein|uniref:hypothetical protein n=1 Tax=Ralstonia pickettii TaxID=329 RepID=UPI0015F9A56D|nr:hypothetical protein [Ralstonia pickettii]MBX4003403.1 hypothetical protein [Ralstonia pickettii]MBX4030204.1 hypothetical protein [Ralstonia pickettii]MBX4071921.1 hypothetical protein [Ralstonia pickettii]MBX4076959.1 hypothetical protein [Ralstonia pickettii]MBX4089883.1 hypothetical protein [Ralstonia pickettii]